MRLVYNLGLFLGMVVVLTGVSWLIALGIERLYDFEGWTFLLAAFIAALLVNPFVVLAEKLFREKGTNVHDFEER